MPQGPPDDLTPPPLCPCGAPPPPSPFFSWQSEGPGEGLPRGFAPPCPPAPQHFGVRVAPLVSVIWGLGGGVPGLWEGVRPFGQFGRWRLRVTRRRLPRTRRLWPVPPTGNVNAWNGQNLEWQSSVKIRPKFLSPMAKFGTTCPDHCIRTGVHTAFSQGNCALGIEPRASGSTMQYFNNSTTTRACGFHRGRTVRCARAVRKAGCFPPPVVTGPKALNSAPPMRF